MSPLFTDEAALEDALSTPTPGLGQVLDGEGDLVILGGGGKVGPTVARMARRALDEAGSSRRVVSVSRWSDPGVRDQLNEWGVQTVTADLGDPAAYPGLPDAGAVLFLVGNKFGTTGNESLTWWMNAVVPGLTASRYRGIPTVVYSSGNVYPFVPLSSGGSREGDPTGPIGQYAQSCLAREQAFLHGARQWGTPLSIYRLNYAVEVRYGVLADIAATLVAGEAIDVTMGAFNAVWQRDSNDWSLRALAHANPEGFILNGTGPEIASTRAAATMLAQRLGIEPRFVGEESSAALLNNSGLAHSLFGYPQVSLVEAIDAVADWVGRGGRQLGKATKFQTRDGKF